MTNQKTPLVSVIVPTYNRAHLIEETLDSISSQIYSNWECIVVDDRSTDGTREVVTSYVESDGRFKFFERPEDRPKGANACRNYGFAMSRGEYVNWYDSDDVMLPDNLEVKISLLQKLNLDFVVARSKCFFNDDAGKTEPAKHGDVDLEPNLENFALSRIIWITDDIMFTRRTIESVAWNERLAAGQEFNFICKYLAKKPKGRFESRVLSLRRMHCDSIKGQRKNPQFNNWCSFYAKYQTFTELDDSLPVRKLLLARVIANFLQLKMSEVLTNNLSLAKSLYGVTGFYDVILFYLMLASKFALNKYKRLYKLLVKRLESNEAAGL